MRLHRLLVRLSLLVLAIVPAAGFAAAPATQPAGDGKLPFIEVDAAARQVRVACEAIRIDAPLEFLAVSMGGPEHEAVLRTPARPSHVHLALLMIGMEQGEPVRFSEATGKWLPPSGPPVRVSVQFDRAGERVTLPAAKLVRSIVEKTPMPDRPFVFTGSRVLDDGRYAADVVGYLVSLVNFDLSPIDVPRLASNANETLEWEINPDLAPPMGTPVTLILEPVGAGDEHAAPTTMPSGVAPAGTSDVRTDDASILRLRQLWDDRVAPHNTPLREAAQAHYDVVNALRREQQRLIDEADRIQRLIDDLDRRYQDMTTPRPGKSP